ncbi:MAG: hypothetical protein ACRD18_00760 [Terriglobia bacterium]
MAGFNLQIFRERFPEVSRAVFGRAYDFRNLEKNFAYLHKDSNWLSVGHVMPLFDPAQSPYARVWPRPDTKQLDQVLKQERLRLAPLNGLGSDLAQNLLRVLHNLGLVSLILRLAYPGNFAIFSGSVANILQVQRPGALDLYIAFCQELGEWQKHFRMSSVAETEMALWSFYQISNSPNGSSEAARTAFDSDIWIQRRRLGQVLRPFMQRYGPLELARLLAEEDPKLAGKIAGEEHERLLRCAAQRFHPHLSVRQKGWADMLISLLAQDGRISLEEKTALRRIWSVRNQAVHPEGPEGAPGLAEVENMIDAIERISLRWGVNEK